MRRTIHGSIIVVALVMLSAGCSKEKEPAQEEAAPPVASDSVVITVDGEGITEGEIAGEVGRLMQMRARQIDAAELESTRRALRPEAADNAVKRLLLKHEVLSRGMEVSDAEVDERYNRIKEDFGSDEVFEARLRRMGMSNEEFRDEVSLGIRVEKLIDMQTAYLADPDEKTLREYYEKNKERYIEPERLRASHILISVNPADNAEVRAEKRKRVEDLLSQIKGGANFAQLAVQNSDCPSKDRGGDLNFFQRGQMVKEFETAAFALEVGEVSDVVETKFGYHIIKVTDRSAERPLGLADAKERVKTDCGFEAQQQAIEQYLERLRASAKIECADSTLIL